VRKNNSKFKQIISVQKQIKQVQKHKHSQKQKVFRSTNKENKQAKGCATKAWLVSGSYPSDL